MEQESKAEIERIKTLLKSGGEATLELAYTLADGFGFDLDAFVERDYLDVFIFLDIREGRTRDKLHRLFSMKHKILFSPLLCSLKIPKNIGTAINLTSLSLDLGRVNEIVGAVEEFTQLKYLSLKNNNLSLLPDSITKLSSLEGLWFRRNSLTKLPDSIGKLSKLKTLDISYNAITSLPESIIDLQQLEDFNLTKNPIADKEIERLREALPNCKIEF